MINHQSLVVMPGVWNTVTVKTSLLNAILVQVLLPYVDYKNATMAFSCMMPFCNFN